MPAYTIDLQTWSTNSSGPGTAPWFSPGYAEQVDGQYAKTNGLVGTAVTQYLWGVNPTPISPGHEQIASLVATVTRASTGTTTDADLALVVGGAITSMNKASATAWPSTQTAAAYTWSSSDLTALGVTLVTVQQGNFGIALSADLNNPTGTGATVDAIVLTVNTTTLPPPLGGMGVLPPYGVR
jgi:hypothetical protein